MDIPELVKIEAKKFDPEAEVILFGSRARGDFHAESDWDFLILLEKQKFDSQLKSRLQDRLCELELKTDTVISAIMHSKSDWHKRDVIPIYQTIKKEGIPA